MPLKISMRGAARGARGTGAAMAVLAACAIGVTPASLAAQALAPKRVFAGGPAAECPATPVERRAAPFDEATRALVERGQEAALVGDRTAARDAFREAARRAPSDVGVTYQLARAHEDLGEASAALRAYCRWLALAPGGGEERDVRARITRLAAVRDASDPMLAAFHEGLAALDRRDHAGALASFTAALSAQPGLPEAQFNRALALEGLGRRADAAAEFERYLAARPRAGDAAAVRAEVAALRRPAKNAWLALGAGLVLPGGGQLYTGHPVQALVVAGLVGGGVFYALDAKDTVPDLCGPPPGRRCFVERRPNLAVGLGVAGGVHVAAALYAMWQARRARPSPSRFGIPLFPEVTPRGAGATVGWRRRF